MRSYSFETYIWGFDFMDSYPTWNSVSVLEDELELIMLCSCSDWLDETLDDDEQQLELG